MFIEAQLHQVLGHASLEVIFYVNGNDITIDKSITIPTTIECKTCSLAKATKVISQCIEVEDQENGTLFDCTTWDIIELTRDYNRNQYISHFQCRQYLFNLVYTYRHKSNTLQLFEKAINIIENQYNRKVQSIRLNRETSLGNAFETLVIEKEIKLEHIALNTLAQIMAPNVLGG